MSIIYKKIAAISCFLVFTISILSSCRSRPHPSTAIIDNSPLGLEKAALAELAQCFSDNVVKSGLTEELKIKGKNNHKEVNEDGFVTTLEVNGHISKCPELPRSLSNLKQLKNLSFAGIGLKKFEEVLFKFTTLEKLNLSGNTLSGKLSEEFLRFKDLVELNLGHNKFTHDSFKILWSKEEQKPGQTEDVYHFAKLVSLDLSGADLSGANFLKELQNLKNLKLLALNKTILPITELGNLPKSLTSLSLTHNEYAEKIPGLQIQSLENLDLSYNKLESTHIKKILKQPFLKKLSLAHNQLDSTVFNEKAENQIQFRISLEELILSHNNLENNASLGKIPLFTNLKVLDLSENSMGGNALFFMKDLKNLEELHLQDNNFAGNFPSKEEIQKNFKNLRVLDISGDYNYKTTTEFLINLGSLENLEVLKMRSKSTLPQAMKNLSNLKTLEVDFIEAATMPNFLGGLKNLRILNLKRIEGTMPSGLANLKDLEEISLEGYYYSENPLQGEALLSQIQQLTKLKKLELNNIKFTGPLPQGIGALTDLRELVLTHCELTGSIPSEIGNLRNLESLDFSDNKLSGSIPDGIWELKKLKNLILSENKLTGSLSEKIGQLRNLTILDISSNKMSGDLPTQAFLDHPSLDKFQENNGFCHLRQGPSWIYEDETNNDSTFTNEESFTKSTLINILPIRHVINRAMQAEPDR